MTSQAKTQPILSSPWVVIPTYNEQSNIKQLIDSLYRLAIPNLTVLIVDDNSPDGTGATVQELQAAYPSLKLLSRAEKSGLGRAYVHGFQHALSQGATAIVQMDADFSHRPLDVTKLLAGLNSYDAVIGSRYIQGISVINWPLKRLLISMGGNLYARVITGLPFRDATGGFRAWRSQVLSAINLSTLQADGYGFQVATIYRAWKRGFKITEIPIVFTERREGQSKMSRHIIFEASLLMWKLRFFDR